jgi:membrane-bound inhibitor of C-type lysozyme
MVGHCQLLKYRSQESEVTFLNRSNSYPDGAAKVTFPDGKKLTLPQVRSASGAKYSDGRTTLWTKGEGAFVEISGKIAFNNCIVIKANADSGSGGIRRVHAPPPGQ